MPRGRGTGEAGEATASPEFRGFTTEKFLASWIYERGNFSCFTGKKLILPPLFMLIIKSMDNKTVKLLIGLLCFISISSFSEWSVNLGEKTGVVSPPDVRDVHQTLRPNFEHPKHYI